MSVLVTGATGFVGTALARALASRGVVAGDLAAPDALTRGFWAGCAVEPRVLDVTDRDAVRAAIAETRARVVIHAAALTPSPEQEREAPVRVVNVNVGGTLNVLDAACAAPGVERVVLVSSAAVYGNVAGRVDETAPLVPAGLYGISKQTAELLGRRYAELYGKPITALRLAAVYGPTERTTPARPRPSPIHALAAALAARRPIKVAGPDLVRDFVHADDVADAVATVLDAPLSGFSVFNVGSGTGIGWHALLALFRARGLATVEAAPAEAEIAVTDPRPVLDCTRLLALGWRPRISLDAGLAMLRDAA